MDAAVDPLWIVIGVAAGPPSAAGAAPAAGASTFMCCEPVASAIVSLVQLRNWKLTWASRLSRTCASGAAGIPVITAADLLAVVRVNP